MKVMVPSCAVRALDRFTEEEKEDGEIVNFTDPHMDCLLGYLATLSVLIEIREKFIVCEFGGFENVLHDACLRAIPP